MEIEIVIWTLRSGKFKEKEQNCTLNTGAHGNHKIYDYSRVGLADRDGFSMVMLSNQLYPHFFVCRRSFEYVKLEADPET